MEGGLNLPVFSNIARQAHILPNIKHLLIPIGALCDAGYTVTFKIKDVTVFYKNDIILRGWINHHTKLWYFPLSSKNEAEKVGDNEKSLVNNVYKKNQSELASLLHKTWFSPVKSTFIKAVNNGKFEIWPGFKKLTSPRLPK